jgi:hypothetical protein
VVLITFAHDSLADLQNFESIFFHWAPFFAWAGRSFSFFATVHALESAFPATLGDQR